MKCKHGMEMICAKCGDDFTPIPMKNNWKEEFDNYFLEKIGKDDGYTEERRIAKDFIESLLEEQKKELAEKVDKELRGVLAQELPIFEKKIREEQKKELIEKLSEIDSLTNWQDNAIEFIKNHHD